MGEGLYKEAGVALADFVAARSVSSMGCQSVAVVVDRVTG